MGVAKGATALSVPSQVGAKWYASCSHPGQQNIECKVENVGLKRVVTKVPDPYLVPRADGRLVVGATRKYTGFNSAFTAGGV